MLSPRHPEHFFNGLLDASTSTIMLHLHLPFAAAGLCKLALGVSLAAPALASDPDPDPDPDLRDALLPTSSVRVVADMPQGVTSFGAAVHDGWLYTLGGYFGVPHVYQREEQSAAFRRMNLADGTWQELPSPGPMQGVALVAHGGYLYRIGGMRIRNGRGEDPDLLSLDEFARYDPLTQEWYALAPLPEARSSHMAAVIGERLYVTGGWQLRGDARRASGEDGWHDTLLVYDLSLDPVEGEWSEIPAPFRRRALGLAAHAGRLYALGGMDRDDGVSQAVDIYDPASGAWSTGPDFPEPGFGMSGVGAGEGLYASGSSGFVYRLGAESWELATGLTFPRFFHQWVVAREGELLAAGGIGRNGRVAHVEALVLRADSERPEVALKHWRVPYPARSGSDRAAFLVGDGLYVLGAPGGDPGSGARRAQDLRLDLGSFQWTTMSDLPAAHGAGLVASCDGAQRALVFGGASRPEGAAAGEGSGAISIYDVELDLWSDAGATPAGDGFSAVSDGSQTWLIGGRIGGRPSQRILRAALRDDRVELEPSDLRLPVAREGFAGAMLGERMYLVGGSGADGGLAHRCDVYDFGQGRWSQIPEPGTHRIDPVLVGLGGKLYLAGGRVHDAQGVPSEVSSVEVFDPATGTWSVLVEQLPVPAEHLRMFAFHDRLLLFSSRSGSGYADVILLDPGERRVDARPTAFHG